MESRRYSHTTVCGGRFHFGSLIMVDSRAALGNKKDDHYGKFHVITNIIEAACSGSTRIIDLCLQILRSTAGRLQRTGKDVTIETLVADLRSNQKLARLLPYLKRMAGPGEIPEGATLLLVSRTGDDNRAVCKVEIEDPISYSFSRLKACGSGYANPAVKVILDSLSYNASIDDVTSKAIDAFEKATKGERFTGGHLIILSSDHGGPWTFYKDHKLTDYEDEDWDT